MQQSKWSYEPNKKIFFRVVLQTSIFMPRRFLFLKHEEQTSAHLKPLCQQLLGHPSLLPSLPAQKPYAGALMLNQNGWRSSNRSKRRDTFNLLLPLPVALVRVALAQGHLCDSGGGLLTNCSLRLLAIRQYFHTDAG